MKPRTRPLDPSTSKAAARSISEQDSRAKTFWLMDGETEFTADRLEQLAEMNKVRIRPSRLRTVISDLAEEGTLVQCGETKTRWGRKARLWKLA